MYIAATRKLNRQMRCAIRDVLTQAKSKRVNGIYDSVHHSTAAKYLHKYVVRASIENMCRNRYLLNTTPASRCVCARASTSYAWVRDPTINKPQSKPLSVEWVNKRAKKIFVIYMRHLFTQRKIGLTEPDDLEKMAPINFVEIQCCDLLTDQTRVQVYVLQFNK